MKNSSRSVAGRLLNISKKFGEEYTFVLMRYGIERLLYRISQSAYSKMFTLKGQLFFLFGMAMAIARQKTLIFLV